MSLQFHDRLSLGEPSTLLPLSDQTFSRRLRPTALSLFLYPTRGTPARTDCRRLSNGSAPDDGGGSLVPLFGRRRRGGGIRRAAPTNRASTAPTSTPRHVTRALRAVAARRRHRSCVLRPASRVPRPEYGPSRLRASVPLKSNVNTEPLPSFYLFATRISTLRHENRTFARSHFYI